MREGGREGRERVIGESGERGRERVIGEGEHSLGEGGISK